MRNNQRRLGKSAPGSPAGPTPPSPLAAATNMSFAVPTEFVELPSQGKLYPEDHPLHQQETVEIRFMTAKDEDIISSESLIKKGLVLNRLLTSLIIDDIDPSTLLIGDRNAILIAARISGYGSEYDLSYRCTGCFVTSETKYDLKNALIEDNCLDSVFLKRNDLLHDTKTQTFDIKLPTSGVVVGLKMLTGQDEKVLIGDEKEPKDNMVTSMLATIISKVNDESDPGYINEFIESMPVKDSKFLRELYPKLAPRVRLVDDFVCPKCYREEEMEVPLSAGFFWPR
jgi:hypothetical protein|tara:strand:- start:8 stop:859 length:852 start_codon:yes stop_codon:yes gene_type:complete